MFRRRDGAVPLARLLADEGISPSTVDTLREHGIVTLRDLLRADWGYLQLLLGPGRAGEALSLDALRQRLGARRAR